MMTSLSSYIWQYGYTIATNIYSYSAWLTVHNILSSQQTICRTHRHSSTSSLGNPYSEEPCWSFAESSRAQTGKYLTRGLCFSVAARCISTHTPHVLSHARLLASCSCWNVVCEWNQQNLVHF